MRIQGLSRYAFSGSAAVALLAGCGGSQPPVAAPGAMMRSYSIARRSDRGKSWMAPDAKAIKELLYISDGATDDVFVYDYKTRALVGKLTGFDQPSSQCVDAKGDVWVLSYGNSSITEYAHGGTQLLRTLRIGGEWPTGCSIDPTTGDLAAAALSGTLDIWRDAKGTPVEFQEPQRCKSLWGPGYDSKGNLYVEASTNGKMVVCELAAVRASGSSLVTVPFNQTIAYGADVMWDGRYITFADQLGGSTTAVYQAEPTASGSLNLVGTTYLNDECGGPGLEQPFVVGDRNTPVNERQGKVVIGPNLTCHGRFDFWSYPRGGEPASTLNAAPYEPSGESVSFST
jgi:hypothetical protein